MEGSRLNYYSKMLSHLNTKFTVQNNTSTPHNIVLHVSVYHKYNRTPRDSVRSTRALGPTMTTRGQSIGISIGMLPQTLIVSITVQNIAWQTHRPEARGPHKIGAWGGRPTCHPQTPPLFTPVNVVSWMLNHFTVLADRLTMWWKSTPRAAVCCTCARFNDSFKGCGVLFVMLFVYVWRSWSCNQVKTVNNLVKHLRLK